MEWVLVGVALAAAAVAGAGLLRRRPRPATAQPVGASSSARRPAVEGPWLGPVATIRLDVAVEDPDTPAVRRLVEGAAGRVLRSSPDVTEVVVEDRTGTTLARVPREAPTPGPPPTRPERAARHARPHGSWREPTVVPKVDQDVRIPPRPLADRLDLPDAVRADLRDVDDPAEVVRAILSAAGRDATVRGHTVRSGDDLVILAEGTGRDAAAAMSEAFLRFRDSGASTGIVVHLGYVDPREVARRQALAPDVHHVGAEVLQAMADAVALGGDPIAFALADAVAS